MRAVLMDLWDTIAWIRLPDPPDQLTAQLGVSEQDLYRAFDLTRSARGVGLFGGPEGDTAAVLAALGIEPEPGRVRELTRQLVEGLPARTRLFDDTMPVLRELRARGTRTAVISNCDHWTRPVVDAFGLEAEVDTVLLSCEIGIMKPDLRIFQTALERLGAEPAQAVFVDDVITYLDGAAALGIATRQIVRETWTPLPDGRRPAGADPAPDRHPVIGDLRALL